MKSHDFSPETWELFDSDGHLTEEAFTLLIREQLDELQSLEVSEHLSYCDRCLERYTNLLCAEPSALPELPDSLQAVSPPLLEPPCELHTNIMNQIQHRNRVFLFQEGYLSGACCLAHAGAVVRRNLFFRQIAGARPRPPWRSELFFSDDSRTHKRDF